MKKNRIKNKIIILLIIILATPNLVFGEEIITEGGYTESPNNTEIPLNPDNPDGGGGGGQSLVSPGQAIGLISSGNWNCSSSCKTNSGTSYHFKNIFATTDLYNNSNNEPYLAGTYFGMALYEHKEATWYGSGYRVYNCSRQVTVWKWCCTFYTTKDGKPGSSCGWDCSETGTESTIINSEDSGCDYQGKMEGYNKAKAAVEIGSSYKIVIPDPNEARCGNLIKYGAELKNEGYNCENYTISATAGATSEPLTNPVIKNYYYQAYGACINVKTSKVRYLTSPTEKCKESEYFIENDMENKMEGEDIRHSHIFIPLNAKETEGFIVELAITDKLEDKRTCIDLIDKYPKDYKERIIPSTGGNFSGIPSLDKSRLENEQNLKCKLIITYDIPVSQKFYGEEITEDSDILKGFNFYYRPIDIDNPFPNGINDDSYWKTWYDTEKKQPNLKESFKEVTYWTNNIDLNSIRKYNEESSYLDWENMNIDGTSSFITDYINRSSTINKNSVYNLGCAPTNMCEYYIKDGKKVENPVYQPECKNAKIGVSCP